MSGRAGLMAIAAVFAFPSLASAATPRAKAHALLSGCYSAVLHLPVVAVRLNTPEVAMANRRVNPANARCNIAPRIDDLAFAHGSDKELAAAYAAAALLELGFGDYVQYLTDAAFGHNNRTELRRAIRETTSGKSLAVAA